MSEPIRDLAVSEEVRRARGALRRGVGALALESTLFTHGLPVPRNLEVARRAERQVRQAGLVPATVGVVEGRPTVGLSDGEIERLASEQRAVKAGERDLPVVAAKGLDAGTTVSATALLAQRAGIRVFATGGVGGVHRGAATSFDESPDLVTLGRTPLVVVSAGAKSLLDVPATLERLETLNVPVLGYRTDRFPGFYVADSGHEVPHRVDGPDEVVAMLRSADALGLRSALLVANPVPEDEQLDPALHERVLGEAQREAEKRGISGHDTTPFLLDHIHRATGERSLEVNVSVYRNNIAVAAEIARPLVA